jgi:hypothetical protein
VAQVELVHQSIFEALHGAPQLAVGAGAASRLVRGAHDALRFRAIAAQLSHATGRPSSASKSIRSPNVMGCQHSSSAAVAHTAGTAATNRRERRIESSWL